MECPRCQSEMRRVTWDTLEIDRCDLCNGVWLDKGELEAVLALELAPMIDEPHFRQPAVPMLGEAARCSACAADMLELVGPDDVHFDWCAGCEGMFFDGGELTIMQLYRPE